MQELNREVTTYVNWLLGSIQPVHFLQVRSRLQCTRYAIASIKIGSSLFKNPEGLLFLFSKVIIIGGSEGGGEGVSLRTRIPSSRSNLFLDK